ncbi:MAG: T9SS type A sorting domain-containing protein [Bacteroidetes bacterium]|nr:T9SS type A sorting domain-containing protein [Bacteroidota bacterium]
MNLRLFLISVLSTLVSVGNAQNSMNSGGFTAPGLSFSIGQVFYTVEEAPSATLQEGVQQVYHQSQITGLIIPDSRLFDVFPNPASNEVYIRLNALSEEPFEAFVFNQLGQLLLLHDKMKKETRLDLSGISQGSYLLLIRYSGSVYTQKLIIL